MGVAAAAALVVVAVLLLLLCLVGVAYHRKKERTDRVSVSPVCPCQCVSLDRPPPGP